MDDLQPYMTDAMLPPAQGNGKKRCRNGSQSERTVRKRIRPCVDIHALSAAQVATLKEAASILQVRLQDLPSALGEVSQTVESAARHQIAPKPVSKHRLQLSPTMEELPGKSKSPPRDGTRRPRPVPRSQPVEQASPPVLSDETCSLPFFGAWLMPKQIADCFANISSDDPDTHAATPNQDGLSHYPSMAYTDIPLLIDTTSNYQSTMSTSDPQIIPNNTVGLNDSYDAGLNHYACDYLTPDAKEFLATIGKSTVPQNIQPFANTQSMVYGVEDADGKYPNLTDLNFTLDLDSNLYGALWLDDFSSPDDLSRSTLISMPAEIGREYQTSVPDDGELEELGPAPRRKFHSADDRQTTAQTRKLTACVRCRMQRIRCWPDPSNPKGACLTCQRVVKPTLRNLPCMRYKVTEVRLFREGSYAAGREWSHRWSSNKMVNIAAWASSEVREMRVTQDYGPTAIAFQVRQFVPLPGDMLQRQWSDGAVVKSVTIPNYAIVDMVAALQAHKDFIVNEGPQFFKSTIDYNDRLLWDTYSMAIQFSNSSMASEEKEVLQMVLQIWVTVRMTTRSPRIAGPETLGMTYDIMDKSSPMHGKIPIPPVLGAQMNFILSHKLLTPLRAKILDRLQKLVLTQKPENWFCIYLCIFVLLHNCSLLIEHDMGYARKHGLKSRHARKDMITELYQGANILLAHFHYCCKGFRPFSLDWNPDESTSMAKLEAARLHFIRQTALYVDHNKSRFERILSEGSYHNEHYLVAQLFEEDWKPRSPV